MKKNRGILVLVMTVLVTAFLIFNTAVGFGPTGTGAAKNIKTGLDLSGGVSITYETSKENPEPDEMQDTIYKLQKRVEQYSTEAQVYQEGENRIIVEIPGVNDANKILEELGKPGSLYFIAHKDSQGNENYTLNTQTGEYELTKTKMCIRDSGILYAKKYMTDFKYMFMGNTNNIWITYYGGKGLILPFSSIDLSGDRGEEVKQVLQRIMEKFQ